MTLRLGALGNAYTFGAEAARLMVEAYPVFGEELAFFPTSDEALRFAGCDAVCVPQQMSKTGLHVRMQSRVAAPGAELYAIADITHAYHCSLLVQHGTTQERIARVLGHTGSVTQSRAWLEANLPWAAIEVVETSSMGAAQEVAGSDGTIASIGTPAMAAAFGLEQLATDIDGHSVCSYWALAPQPHFAERPDRIVVAGRFADDGRLSALIAALREAGFGLQSVFSAATGDALFAYDYTLCLRGSGALADVRAAVAAVPPARLAGAYVQRA